MNIEEYKVLYELNVDLKKQSSKNSVKVMQYESAMRYILIRLFDGNRAYHIPDGFPVNVRMNKPDNIPVYNPVKFEENKAYLLLTQQMCGVVGTSEYCIEIVRGNEVLNTFPLYIQVVKNPTDEDDFTSQPEYLTIQKLAQDAEDAANRAEEAAERAEEAETTGGGYYTPNVTQETDDTIELSWSPSKEAMPELPPVNLTLPKGPQGPEYELTEEDKQTIAMSVLQLAVPNGDEVSY